MKDIVERIKDRGRLLAPRIVLPETSDERILATACRVRDEGFARPVLLGSPGVLRDRARGLGLDLGSIEILDPATDERRPAFLDLLRARLVKKGRQPDEIAALLDDPLHFGALLVRSGSAEGQVAGSISETATVLRAGLALIDLTPGTMRISGAFLMVSPRADLGADGVALFADCAVNPFLTPAQLAAVAVDSARTFRALTGLEPRVAMLSFSTKGSARHERIDRVLEATARARELAPELAIDGELQADAALVAAVGQRKAPGSPVAGQANVLIFPDLDSGNLGYKLVQRYGGCQALGPIIQGFARPIHDLSRGATIDDIVGTVAIAAAQAASLAGA